MLDIPHFFELRSKTHSEFKNCKHWKRAKSGKILFMHSQEEKWQEHKQPGNLTCVWQNIMVMQHNRRMRSYSNTSWEDTTPHISRLNYNFKYPYFCKKKNSRVRSMQNVQQAYFGYKHENRESVNQWVITRYHLPLFDNVAFQFSCHSSASWTLLPICRKA